MSSRFFGFSLPLLVKELTEQAARKRTYVIRVLFAMLLMTMFGFALKSQLTNEFARRLDVLGNGRQMFKSLIGFQLLGILLFLPAMTAGQLTMEKERDSLALLFLTRLGPWQIVLQKYLGVLVPILSLLCAAMPLAAIAYAYGGVTQTAIGSGIYVLTLTALQVAAFALLCSAWCRTTVGAFLSTYFLGAVIYLFAPLLQMAFREYKGHSPDFLDWLVPICPIDLLNNDTSQSWQTLLVASIPAWLSTLLFLELARFFLVRRAFVRGANPMLRLFRWIDGCMQRLNRVTGNIRVGKGGDDLPSTDPIAWREMRRNVLARPHYLLRMLLAVEIPTVVIGLMLFEHSDDSELSVFVSFLAALAVLIISVNAANAFVTERVNQTLDVLLTTPMSARQMVLEKARALHRFFYVAAVPLLTLCLMKWILMINQYEQYRGSYWRVDPPALYLFCCVLNLVIWPPLISWVSLWVGLKTKTRFRAIITALLVVVLWCVLPIVVSVFASRSHSLNLGNGVLRWVAGCSPLLIPILNEASALHEFKSTYPWFPVVFNFAFYGGLTGLIRRYCLRHADFYLRRS